MSPATPPTPTRKTIDPAANRKPRKRTSSLIWGFHRISDQQDRPAHQRSHLQPRGRHKPIKVRSTRFRPTRSPTAEALYATFHVRHERQADDISRFVAPFYGQTEASPPPPH